MNSFEELEVWKKSRALRIEINALIKELPEIEKKRLGDQMIRSARSISANIAEGFGRFNFQENIQFCRISRGSLFELLEHCYVSLDEGFITIDLFEKNRGLIMEVLKILNGYINYLMKAKSAYISKKP